MALLKSLRSRVPPPSQFEAPSGNQIVCAAFLVADLIFASTMAVTMPEARSAERIAPDGISDALIQPAIQVPMHAPIGNVGLIGAEYPRPNP